ncbi:MAG: hypothetical protein P9X24_14675 [Candidatus Hatepunaea meridiana]|nr:hypothetical protein [Candidatus Hatepunaea meridiana]
MLKTKFFKERAQTFNVVVEHSIEQADAFLKEGAKKREISRDIQHIISDGNQWHVVLKLCYEDEEN